MERRNLFRILGATGLSEVAKAVPAPPYAPKFFTPVEAAAVERLADIILPADAESPGAQEAGVLRYIDLIVQYGDAAQKQAWRSGLQAVSAEATRRFRQPFEKLTRAQQEQIVAGMAENEGKRTDPVGEFFVPLKRLTVEAYHYSAAFWKKRFQRDMNVALAKFDGCS